jgi:LacI family transcriptional regulator
VTPRRANRVTIKTVAEDAGVSTAAVSKVLRNAYGVSEALRARVQASMSKLGYRPHAAARGMRGQTYTLGVLLPDLRNPFFGDIMAGVNAALERTQYQQLLGSGGSLPLQEQALVEAMIDRQMDGLILVAPRLSNEAINGFAERLPIVVIARHPRQANTFDTVNGDDVLGARLAVQHLVEGGYRKITLFSLEDPGPDDAVTVMREIGYREAMKAADLSRFINIVAAEQIPRDSQLSARRLLEQRYRPEALICWSDVAAFEVLSVAHELGLRVPGDLAMVGYDNNMFCDLAQNALTSIDQSGQVLGLQAARLVIERIKGREKAEHFVVTPRLVARASSRSKVKPAATR